MTANTSTIGSIEAALVPSFGALSTKLNTIIGNLNVLEATISKKNCFDYDSTNRAERAEEVKKLFKNACSALQTFETYALQHFAIEARSWKLTSYVVKLDSIARSHEYNSSSELPGLLQDLIRLHHTIAPKVEKPEQKPVDSDVEGLKKEVKRQGSEIEELKQEIKLLKMALIGSGEAVGSKRSRPNAPES